MALEPGTILRLFFRDISTPKEKYGVLISANPVRFFLINSRLSSFVHNTAAARRAQLEIDANGHPCLEYDSWLDCTEYYDGQFDTTSLERFVESRPHTVQGSISDKLRGGILQAVEESVLLSPQEKTEIIEALGTSTA